MCRWIDIAVRPRRNTEGYSEAGSVAVSKANANALSHLFKFRPTVRGEQTICFHNPVEAENNYAALLQKSE